MRGRWIGAALAGLVLWGTAVARAQEIADPITCPSGAAVPAGSFLADERSEFWRRVAEPRHRRATTLLRHAVRRLEDFQQPPHDLGPAQRRAILEGAIHRLELAHRIAPREPEILFLLAQSKSRWWRRGPAGAAQRMDEEALELFQQLRRIDPTYEAASVAFELGVLHTRARRFERAAEEYRCAISNELLVGSSPTAWGNLAEVTMLGGDVQEAVLHFERAAELWRRAGGTGSLALWGLAVALDRLGEHRVALDRAADAIQAGPGGMQELHIDGVFFEPDWEIHWYEALGHEAMAEREGRGTTRAEHLRRSFESWETFLRASGGQSPWHQIAVAHRDRLRRMIDGL